MAKALTISPAPQYGSKVLHPEVIDSRIADVEALARWMDYAFVLPGGFRFGLAGLIGLIPGIGDIFDAALSLYIVWRAVELGVTRVTLARMAINVGIEAVGGALPFLGALFDTVFKANRRNYQLLSSHLAAPRQQTSKDWWFVLIVAVVSFIGVSLPLILIAALIRHL